MSDKDLIAQLRKEINELRERLAVVESKQTTYVPYIPYTPYPWQVYPTPHWTTTTDSTDNLTFNTRSMAMS